MMYNKELNAASQTHGDYRGNISIGLRRDGRSLITHEAEQETGGR